MRFRPPREILALLRKLRRVSWPLLFATCALAGIGTVMLYSAGHGSWEPWARAHLLRFGLCLALAVAVAVTDIRFWWRHAYAIYGAFLALLVAVEVTGDLGMGAQRWIDLGIIRLQPSEPMKIGLVLALARYYHGLSLDRARSLASLIPPAALAAAPAALALRQPDLGTAISMLLIGLAVLFVAGVRIRVFATLFVAAAAALPVAWNFLLPYQRQRIWSFLDPGTDPLGAGYHILQSKIALGAGGVHGKGFLEGTQSQLRFLPEIHTDFVFTMLAEEFGMAGGLVLMAIYCIVVFYGIAVALQSRNHFGRILSLGIAISLFMFLSVNIAMVTGLVPVVGVPLPLVSHGGTAMLATMFGIGLVISVSVHRHVNDLHRNRKGWGLAGGAATPRPTPPIRR